MATHSQMKAHCKHHPWRVALARQLCSSCYPMWRYHNVPGAKAARIAQVTAYQKRRGRFRKPKIETTRHLHYKEGHRGMTKDILSFSRADDAALNACVRRLGLVRRPFMSRWRQAA